MTRWVQLCSCSHALLIVLLIWLGSGCQLTSPHYKLQVTTMNHPNCQPQTSRKIQDIQSKSPQSDDAFIYTGTHTLSLHANYIILIYYFFQLFFLVYHLTRTARTVGRSPTNYLYLFLFYFNAFAKIIYSELRTKT
jgi:hypothetical protein